VIASGHTILSGLNLSIAAGEHVAIVGPSGAGKSSFMGLLLGWHHLASGRLLVDGHDLDGSHLDSLRRQTAWVDPAIQLWNRSFLDNLTYSTAVASLKHVAAAVDAADLRHVLHKLPSGLQSALGEGGAMLSGGEGQRIRLGRAFMQTGVRLALLDEPFRGMDRQQRARLMDEARYHWRDATLICITHDVGETHNFDRVIVVENGSVAEDGAPDQLMASDTRYRALLAAEHVARDKLWQGNHWDHLRIENGHVIRLS
jgi:ATP-binding cassette subfamily B protein